MNQERWGWTAYRPRSIWQVLLAWALFWVGAPLPARAQQPPDAPAPRTIVPNTNEEVVYIDFDGFIRTYDPDQLDLQWVSPTGGWRDLALGDVNGDGDMEIVVIGGEGSAGQLAVYDPVVASGAPDPDNGYGDDVYWELLFQTPLPGTPRLVTTGAFLPTFSGGAFPVGFAVAFDDPDVVQGPDNDTRIRVYVPANSPPDGRQWQILADHNRNASRMAAGNIDGVGGDDLIIVDRVRRGDSELIALAVQADGVFVRLFDDEDVGVEEWVDATVGRVDPSYGRNDVAAIRESSPTTPRSLYVIRFFGLNNAGVIYERSFVPAPFTIFLGDITNDGTEEIFFLRGVTCNPAVSASAANPPQLFLRTPVPGSTVSFEVCLDADNAFRRGASGDLDGDGRTELVVISRFQLRIFNRPEESTTEFTNVALASNAVALAVGNLDASGNARIARLDATTTSIDTSLPAGASLGPINIQIFNGGTQEVVPFTVATVPAAPYVAWTINSSQTPANLAVTLDASMLIPGGVFGANIVVTAQSGRVANSPMVIPVILRVTGVAINPAQMVVMVLPCDHTAVPPLEPITRTLAVIGDQASWGRTFSVAIEPGQAAREGAAPVEVWPPNPQVPWMTASSPTTNVPSAIEVVVDPNQAADEEEALLVLTSPQIEDKPTLQFTSKVRFICTDNAVFAPVVINN